LKVAGIGYDGKPLSGRRTDIILRIASLVIKQAHAKGMPAVIRQEMARESGQGSDDRHPRERAVRSNQPRSPIT
jgi:hypothetical protein